MLMGGQKFEAAAVTPAGQQVLQELSGSRGEFLQVKQQTPSTLGKAAPLFWKAVREISEGL